VTISLIVYAGNTSSGSADIAGRDIEGLNNDGQILPATS